MYGIGRFFAQFEQTTYIPGEKNLTSLVKEDCVAPVLEETTKIISAEKNLSVHCKENFVPFPQLIVEPEYTVVERGSFLLPNPPVNSSILHLVIRGALHRMGFYS